MVKTCSDGEDISFCLLKNDLPVPILAAGFSVVRRDYLRDNVRSILLARGREGFPC
ncbi:hypothetical protein DPMN_007087 [Dreissena polymorpha]|uniref:Uncharacterized protein n=1 Tax=Dreissena polymorpha TaxID=45954 RepID=A0A9D4MXT9_DREPO|nr:hypothetical protein DPMN_007087 [Dreissena polymorpha]